jgi:hypothetical protein
VRSLLAVCFLRDMLFPLRFEAFGGLRDRRGTHRTTATVTSQAARHEGQ